MLRKFWILGVAIVLSSPAGAATKRVVLGWILDKGKEGNRAALAKVKNSAPVSFEDKQEFEIFCHNFNVFRNTLKRNPEEIRYMIGIMKYMSDLEGEIAHQSNLSEIAYSHFVLAKGYIELLEFDRMNSKLINKAMEHIGKAIDVGFDEEEFYYYRGIANLYINDLEEALSDFTRFAKRFEEKKKNKGDIMYKNSIELKSLIEGDGQLK